MKKFKYEQSPFIILNKETKTKIIQEMENKISFEKSSFLQKIIFSKFYFLASILLWIFILGYIMLLIRQKNWQNKNIKLLVDLNQSNVYKIIFENLFDNVKVSEEKNIPYSVISKYRGVGIPKDAKAHKINIGPTFKINKIQLITQQVLWRWTRSNGKTTTTYYSSKIYAYSNQLKSQYNNFNLKFKESKLFSKRGNDLENIKFNKKFWYEYNDEKIARLFFPLSAQERWVDVISKNNKNYKLNNFDININNGEYLIGKKTTQKSEYGNLYIKNIVKNKKEYINSVYENLIQDVEEITILFRLALINKYFFK